MLLKIEIDVEDAIEMLDSVAAVLTSAELANAAGAFAVDRILQRTLSGKDVNDIAFTPYSAAYARKKGGKVNLSASGEMLGSIDFQSGSSTETTITCDSDIAGYHEDGTSDMPQRQFMGLSDKDIGDMMEEIFTGPLTELVG